MSQTAIHFRHFSAISRNWARPGRSHERGGGISAIRLQVRVRLVRLVLLTLFLTSFPAHGLQAQPREEQNRHEFLLLDIDVAATKKFATVQNHLRVGQLTEAVELLRNISESQNGKLVQAGPGRYVHWRTFAHMLSAALPPEGLKTYREQFDPILRPTFEAGRDGFDEQLLLKVVEQGYCCTFADEALLLLGDLAWDDGDLWRARGYWEQLLPPLQPKTPGEPVILLGYPDSNVDRNLVLGRLALCSIQAGRFDSARRTLRRLAETQPEPEGFLAGRSGKLREIIQAELDQAEKTPAPVRSSLFETFGGNPRRFDRVQSSAGIGTVQWSAELKPCGVETDVGFTPGRSPGAGYFPVVYGDIVLVHDGIDVYAYRLETGAPVWPGDDKSARIFSVDDLTPVASNRGPEDRAMTNIGMPRYTMTVADGRLYARMGSLLPSNGDRSGVLVCLDLAHGEGKPVWYKFASTVEAGDDKWDFEGSPLVVGDRLFVGLRKTNPQPQSNVACFDARTGKLLWNRKLCVGSANPNIADFDVNQHLLTWGDGTLYYATHMGAVAAIDPLSGTTKWLVTYPRVDDPKFRHELDARLRRGPLPAMFADGTVYVAPLDSDEVLAIDAETGVVKWTRSFQSPIQSLLGASSGLVYISGAQLWAVSAQSGRIVWPQAGDRDPESAGFGRGLLVGDSIYWPNHEEILIVDQATGAVRQRFPLAAAHGQAGGNLLLVDDYLVVAQPDKIAVFADRPEIRKLPPSEIQPSRPSSPALRPFYLGRIEAAGHNWEMAADQFRRARELSQAADEWLGQPLTLMAGQREFESRLQLAHHAIRADRESPKIPSLLQNAIRCAPDLPRRGLTLALAVEWLRLNRGDESRAFAKQILNDPALTSMRLRFAREGPENLSHWASKRSAVAEVQLPRPRQRVEQTEVQTPQTISELPWPLTRHWKKSFGDRCRFIVPTGLPSSGPRCILADRPPLACLNPADGSVLWQVRLSHPLDWAVYHDQTLLLATSHEVRSVSLSNGTTVWRRTLNSAAGPLKPPHHIAFSAAVPGQAFSSNPIAEVWTPLQFRLHDGLLSEFLFTDGLVLIRQGDRRIVACQAHSGDTVWDSEPGQGVAPGLVCSRDHLVFSTRSPGTLISLDVQSGVSSGANVPGKSWTRAPIIRDDGTILAVEQTGQITSWSKPGPAWFTEEGPLAWEWKGLLTQSHQPPQVLSQGDVSLLNIDGDTLVVVDSLTGAMLWKVGLGRNLVEQIEQTLTTDESRVYVPADGILRAYQLKTGNVAWERSVGPPDQSWKSQRIGDAIVVHPAQILPESTGMLTICDAATGQVRQRLRLDPPSNRAIAVSFYAVGSEALLIQGGTIIGLSRP